ncbi:MAG: hypothetical protein HUK26_09905 [Duodenibacillus sp.]|nr:hypothetical protein [Duodenibacillus sp.]
MSRSLVLTERIDASWEELKRASELAMLDARREAERPAAPQHSAAYASLNPEQRRIVDDVADEVTAEVLARVKEQMSIVLEMAVNNMASRLRKDLGSALAEGAQEAVREALARKLGEKR